MNVEIYKELYEAIMDSDFTPTSWDDTDCDLCLDIESFYFELRATFEIDYIDNSFDHAFGTEYVEGDFVKTYLDDIVVYRVLDENDDDITKDFDYDKFWQQFISNETQALYSKKMVKSGDEVVACLAGKYPRWITATYLSTDLQRNLHICKAGASKFMARWVRLPKEGEKRYY